MTFGRKVTRREHRQTNRAAAAYRRAGAGLERFIAESFTPDRQWFAVFRELQERGGFANTSIPSTSARQHRASNAARHPAPHEGSRHQRAYVTRNS